MLRGLFYIIPFFCWLPSFGQSETKETFISKIFTQTPYSNWKKVYLSDTASGWGKFDLVDSLAIITPAVRDSIPNSTLSELVANCASNFSEKWRPISQMKVMNANARRFRRQKHGSLMLKLEMAFISNVVFDNGQNYAMVRMGRVCGKSCGDSCVYLFKKVNNKWHLVLKVGCTIV